MERPDATVTLLKVYDKLGLNPSDGWYNEGATARIGHQQAIGRLGEAIAQLRAEGEIIFAPNDAMLRVASAAAAKDTTSVQTMRQLIGDVVYTHVAAGNNVAISVSPVKLGALLSESPDSGEAFLAAIKAAGAVAESRAEHQLARDASYLAQKYGVQDSVASTAPRGMGAQRTNSNAQPLR